MLHTMKSRRGATLAEIMIALALVAIFSTMVFSSVILIAKRTQASAVNDAMRHDCSVIEVAAERWLDAWTQNGAVFCEDTLIFGDSVFHAMLPNGDEITVHTETIRTFSATVLPNTNGDRLLICYVTCQHPQTEETVDLTFCVNSRLGEKRGLTIETPAS